MIASTERYDIAAREGLAKALANVEGDDLTRAIIQVVFGGAVDENDITDWHQVDLGLLDDEACHRVAELLQHSGLARDGSHGNGKRRAAAAAAAGTAQEALPKYDSALAAAEAAVAAGPWRVANYHGKNDSDLPDVRTEKNGAKGGGGGGSSSGNGSSSDNGSRGGDGRDGGAGGDGEAAAAATSDGTAAKEVSSPMATEAAPRYTSPKRNALAAPAVAKPLSPYRIHPVGARVGTRYHFVKGRARGNSTALEDVGTRLRIVVDGEMAAASVIAVSDRMSLLLFDRDASLEWLDLRNPRMKRQWQVEHGDGGGDSLALLHVHPGLEACVPPHSCKEVLRLIRGLDHALVFDLPGESGAQTLLGLSHDLERGSVDCGSAFAAAMRRTLKAAARRGGLLSLAPAMAAVLLSVFEGQWSCILHRLLPEGLRSCGGGGGDDEAAGSGAAGQAATDSAPPAPPMMTAMEARRQWAIYVAKGKKLAEAEAEAASAAAGPHAGNEASLTASLLAVAVQGATAADTAAVVGTAATGGYTASAGNGAAAEATAVTMGIDGGGSSGVGSNGGGALETQGLPAEALNVDVLQLKAQLVGAVLLVVLPKEGGGAALGDGVGEYIKCEVVAYDMEEERHVVADPAGDHHPISLEETPFRLVSLAPEDPMDDPEAGTGSSADRLKLSGKKGKAAKATSVPKKAAVLRMQRTLTLVWAQAPGFSHWPGETSLPVLNDLVRLVPPTTLGRVFVILFFVGDPATAGCGGEQFDVLPAGSVIRFDPEAPTALLPPQPGADLLSSFRQLMARAKGLGMTVAPYNITAAALAAAAAEVVAAEAAAVAAEEEAAAAAEEAAAAAEEAAAAAEEAAVAVEEAVAAAEEAVAAAEEAAAVAAKDGAAEVAAAAEAAAAGKGAAAEATAQAKTVAAAASKAATAADAAAAKPVSEDQQWEVDAQGEAAGGAAAMEVAGNGSKGGRGDGDGGDGDAAEAEVNVTANGNCTSNNGDTVVVQGAGSGGGGNYNGYGDGGNVSGGDDGRGNGMDAVAAMEEDTNADDAAAEEERGAEGADDGDVAGGSGGGRSGAADATSRGGGGGVDAAAGCKKRFIAAVAAAEADEEEAVDGDCSDDEPPPKKAWNGSATIPKATPSKAAAAPMARIRDVPAA